MVYLYSFLFSGTICLIGELIYRKTKLTYGHITSLLVCLGSLLEISGIYKYLESIFESGITSLILNFGSLITRGILDTYEKEGIINIFKGGFLYTSAVISFTIFLSIILSILPKWRKQ